MKSIDQVGTTFVNNVLSFGHLNGVINVEFGTLQFTIAPDGKTIDPDPAVSARLRMDLPCAMALRTALDQVITGLQNADAQARVDAAEALAGITESGARAN